MKNTKQKIMESALGLFNDLGYSNVTIRMIAEKISISSGNLNYHFSTKVEILEALYFEMAQVVDVRLEKVADKHYNVGVLYDGMLASMAVMYEYRFFWTDIYFLQKQSQSIKEHLKNSILKELRIWKLIVEKLVEANILQKKILRHPNILIVDRTVDFANTWIFTASLHEYKLGIKEMVNHQATYLLYSFYPFFTKKGIDELKTLMK